MMANSRIREVRVAAAAPVTPRAGAPRLPKMKTQFKTVLAHMEMEKTISPSLGFSMERWAPTYTPVMLLNR